MVAGFALILGPPATVAVAANLLTGALSAIMLRVNHNLSYASHLELTHYPRLKAGLALILRIQQRDRRSHGGLVARD